MYDHERQPWQRAHCRRGSVIGKRGSKRLVATASTYILEMQKDGTRPRREIQMVVIRPPEGSNSQPSELESDALPLRHGVSREYLSRKLYFSTLDYYCGPKKHWRTAD